MQVLKAEIRNQILKSAEHFYYLQGYEGTSMRQVADDAGMSVSNLYKYFKNKEDLYMSVVSEYAHQFIREFKMAISYPRSDKYSWERIQKMVKGLSNNIQSNRRLFVILMKKSKGSPFEKFSENLADILQSHSNNENVASSVSVFFHGIISNNLFGAIADIAYQEKSGEWTYRQLELLFKYHMAGMAALEG